MVGRKVTKLYVLILYPDTLLSLSLLVDIRWVFVLSYKHIFCKKVTLISSFPIFCLFVSFSCQIILDITDITIFTNSSNTRYHCLVPDLRKFFFIYSFLSLLLFPICSLPWLPKNGYLIHSFCQFSVLEPWSTSFFPFLSLNSLTACWFCINRVTHFFWQAGKISSSNHLNLK